jgi:hypothetical protein
LPRDHEPGLVFFSQVINLREPIPNQTEGVDFMPWR